jgi:antitoxin component YwqK of YwqJK toxin-antitoxin module
MNSLPNDLLRLFLINTNAKVTYALTVRSRRNGKLLEKNYLDALMKQFTAIKQEGLLHYYLRLIFINSKLPNGWFHGISQILRSDGSLVVQTPYYKNKQHGIKEWWYNNGKQEKRQQYTHDIHRAGIGWKRDGTVSLINYID